MQITKNVFSIASRRSLSIKSPFKTPVYNRNRYLVLSSRNLCLNSSNFSPIKTITLRTCVGIYDRLREERPKLYRDAPSEGIDITVDYYDNLNSGTDHPEKTIVAVHGTPGNYTHFDPIPEYFTGKNVRVIVPNLPNFADTRRTKAFWHSTEEKYQFLKDFLEKLNVKKIDCLISHSFGIQTASQFWDQCGDVEIGSFAIFSPNTTWFYANRKEYLAAKLVFLFREEWWYNLLDRIKIYQFGLIPVRLENINELFMMASAGIERQSPIDLPQRIDMLVRSVRPVILLYGTRDGLISDRSMKAIRERLGIKEDEIVDIDMERDNPEVAVRMTRRIMQYNLKDGGHFAHANFHPFTIKMVENLLDYQRK